MILQFLYININLFKIIDSFIDFKNFAFTIIWNFFFFVIGHILQDKNIIFPINGFTKIKIDLDSS